MLPILGTCGLVSIFFAAGYYIIRLVAAFYIPNWNSMTPPELPTHTPVFNVREPEVVYLLPPTNDISAL
jgi:hypothetical protein